MSNATAPMSRSELEAFWMPFTANRQFKAKPRLLAKASGMHYWTPEGRQILDAVAGLWCVNAGHGRREIVQAVASQLETMEYAPPFQMGHPAGFALANELVKISPAPLKHVFFTNSGSESVDTALKLPSERMFVTRPAEIVTAEMLARPTSPKRSGKLRLSL